MDMLGVHNHGVQVDFSDFVEFYCNITQGHQHGSDVILLFDRQTSRIGDQPPTKESSDRAHRSIVIQGRG